MALVDEKNLTSPSAQQHSLWIVWGGCLLLLILVFRAGLDDMLDWWETPEYSHGYFIPCITIYLIWLRRSELTLTSTFKESLSGLLIMAFGMAVFLLGNLAAIRTLEQYAFLIEIAGIFAAALGMQGLRVAWVPLFFLIFMVPFPNFIINNLSSKLQLISSWLGVEFIRACNIMVYLEGNVIDLGVYKLQVVDACSGLRYLFPLSSLAFLCA